MGSYLGYGKRRDSVMGLSPQITKLDIEGALPQPIDKYKQCTYHNKQMKEMQD